MQEVFTVHKVHIKLSNICRYQKYTLQKKFKTFDNRNQPPYIKTKDQFPHLSPLISEYLNISE